MNTAEAARLLLAVSAYDGREVLDGAPQAWAASLPDVPIADALEWLPGHFRENRHHGFERLMPADVLDGVSVLHKLRLLKIYREARERALEAGMALPEAINAGKAARDAALDANHLAPDYADSVRPQW